MGGTYLQRRSEMLHPVVDGPGWVTPWEPPGRPPSGTQGYGEDGLVLGREDLSWQDRRMIRGTSSSSSSSPVDAAITRVWSRVTREGGLKPREGETGSGVESPLPGGAADCLSQGRPWGWKRKDQRWICHLVARPASTGSGLGSPKARRGS